MSKYKYIFYLRIKIFNVYRFVHIDQPILVFKLFLNFILSYNFSFEIIRFDKRKFSTVEKQAFPNYFNIELLEYLIVDNTSRYCPYPYDSTLLSFVLLRLWRWCHPNRRISSWQPLIQKPEALGLFELPPCTVNNR